MGKRIVVTGGAGNLGSKLTRFLCNLNNEEVDHVVVLDVKDAETVGVGEWGMNATYVKADLRKRGQWEASLSGCDVVVHFAAQNAYPDGTWQDSSDSMDINNNVYAACIKHKVCRVIFASSNHVMGGYMPEGPTLDVAQPITASLPPHVGTKFAVGNYKVDSTPYAAAKLMGERAGLHIAQTTDIEVICVRIGWCQPGENYSSTLNPFGKPADMVESSDDAPQTQDDPTYLANLLSWFQMMWLSNKDFTHLYHRLVFAPWPTRDHGKSDDCKHAIVYGMSANSKARWDLEGARSLFGYCPVSDAANTRE